LSPFPEQFYLVVVALIYFLVARRSVAVHVKSAESGCQRQCTLGVVVVVVVVLVVVVLVVIVLVVVVIVILRDF
jgi:hypothetical protein